MIGKVKYEYAGRRLELRLGDNFRWTGDDPAHVKIANQVFSPIHNESSGPWEPVAGVSELIRAADTFNGSVEDVREPEFDPSVVY